MEISQSSTSAPDADSLLTIGNAGDPSAQGLHGGWFVGPYIDESGPLHSHHVEVKWGQHDVGETRVSEARSSATTLSVLVGGIFELRFPELDRAVTLDHPGDFVCYRPNVVHTWTARSRSTVLTVRWWSSRPTDIEPEAGVNERRAE